MSKVCAECTYLNISNGDLYGKFYCEKKYERHLATDVECSRFCEAYTRDYKSIKNAIEYSNDHISSGGCFLTTIICDILKLPDDNEYLTEMRKFRNNFLQKDEKYSKLLVEYDIIGPKIAEALNSDPLKEKIALIYFGKYIKTIVKELKVKNYKTSIDMYKAMTNSLKEFYGLSNLNITNLEIEKADINKSGHGKYKIKEFTI